VPRYIVHSGDTLTAIATRFGVDLAALRAANPQVSDPDRIFPGQVVTIPGRSPALGSDYVIQPGDTLTAIATRFGVELAALRAANPQVSDPNRIFPGQVITVTAVITYVRHDIWTLDQIDQWHPIIYAYARGVRVLMDRSNVNPLDPIGWQYQSDVHGTAVNRDRFRNQCQHFTWFFLPWHRMYLEWFERIIRSAIADLADIDDETKRTWALPYWNYSSDDAARRRLPRAFLDMTLPNGVTPNPLRVRGRNLNNGSALPAEDVGLTNALAPIPFAGVGGFAGGRTGFSHAGEDPGSSPGPLEVSPHGAVHVDVGGLMAAFNTAALDPIFWLHHANIDRLWEVWRGMPGRSNTTEAAWLTGVTFHFHDENAAELDETVQEVLETEEQLHYRYEDISAPVEMSAIVGLEAAVGLTPEPENPPELVGASDSAVALRGDTASITFGISAPQGPVAGAASPGSRAYLRLEDVTAPAPAGVTYGVYLNVPDGEAGTDEAHYVGVAAFFGVEETRDPDNEHGGMRLAFDITDLYNRLNTESRWNDQVTVIFVPHYVDPPETPVEMPSDEVSGPQQPGNIRVGRVSVFVQ
jgi:tyrosinase